MCCPWGVPHWRARPLISTEPRQPTAGLQRVPETYGRKIGGIRDPRRAVNGRLKVRFGYRDLKERRSERTVRPLALAFYGPVWLLASWCELRQDFRSFRLDRISDLAVLPEAFPPERGKTIQDFLKRDTE